ncbi:MAG TPA: hypothetical protein DIT32_05265 [Peptococcaceae bacterium]|nr:hypothetical protein [Peptococcaceae bacterium]
MTNFVQANRLKTYLQILVILFAVLRLGNYFIQLLPLQILSCAIMLLVIVYSLPKMDALTRRVILAMFLIGGVLLVISGASPVQWLIALLKNANLATLLICAPMLSAPFFYEDYQSDLKALAQVKMQNLLSFCVLTMVSAHLLGVLVGVGAVIIIYELLNPFQKLYDAETPFLKALSRGYNSSGFWSPAWASVIVYSAYPDVKWTTIVPIAIVFTILFNGISIAGLYLETRQHPDRYKTLLPDRETKIRWNKIVTMLVLAAAMIGTILLLDKTTGWDLMLIVPAAALVFPLLSATVQNHWQGYKKGMVKFYNTSLIKVQSQVALYAAAGFLGKAMELSGVGAMIPKLLPQWLIDYPAMMVGALILLMILPSLAGIHPAATGTAMVAALVPASLGLDNYTFCMAIIFGWLITILASPFSATSLILAGNTGKSNWSVSVAMNWKFCLVTLIVFSGLISLVGPML